MAYFRKSKSLYSSTLSGSISTGTGETISPSSVAGLPTDTEMTLTIDRVDANGNATPAKLERISGTISGGNLISYTRGVDNTTEQPHSAGAIIEAIWSAKDWNDAIDGILTITSQTGGLKNSQTVSDWTIKASRFVNPSVSGTFYDVYANEALLLAAPVSNTINYVKISSAAISNYPIIEAVGDDTNIKLKLLGKGTGTVQYYVPTASAYYDLLATDTDGTLADNSDTKLATQKAIKTYVDGKSTALVVTDVDNTGGSSTTSSTYADITGADVSIVTTAASTDILITGVVQCYANPGALTGSIDYRIQIHDGTSGIGQPIGVSFNPGNTRKAVPITHIIKGVAAGTHTYTLQHKSENNVLSCTAEQINFNVAAFPS